MKKPCLLFITTLLTGCLTTQPLPNVSVPENAKIGFISLVDDHPVHAHIGTTVFNNKKYVRSEQWNLSQRLYEYLNSELSGQGYKLVHLNPTEELSNERLGLIKSGWTSFYLSNLAAHLIESYKISYGVDAVIIFAPFTPDTGGSRFHGYGLYSQGMFGMNHFQPLANVRTLISTTSQPQLIGWDNTSQYPVALKISFDGRLQDLPPAEFNKAEKPVWNSVFEDAQGALVDAGLL